MRSLLLGWAVLAACGQVNPQRDAADPPSGDAALGAWSTPVPVAELNGPSIDQDPTLTADGLQVVFVSDRPGALGADDLWSATRATPGAPFGAPTLIPNVSSASSEQHPWISPDGLLMYFSSDRAGTSDIFVTVRASRTAPWSTPSAVAELNTPSLEQVGGMTADLLTFAFVSDRSGPTTGRDIYISTRSTLTSPWSLPVVVTELATPGIESAPVFAGQGTAIYFVRDSDLYVADRIGGAIGAPRKIEELSTPSAEGDPHVTEDQRTLLFSRDADIYISTR